MEVKVKKSLTLVIIIVLLAVTLTSCNPLSFLIKTVEGSGEMIVEKRDLPMYNAIEAHGDFELFITQLDTGVEVHAESNLMKYVRTYVEDQTLVVEIADTDGSSINLKPLEPIKVYVKLVKVNSLALSGGVEMTSGQLLADDAKIDLSFSGGSKGIINAVRTGTLTISLSGESNLQVVDGQVEEQHIQASGESSYTADWLKSEVTEIQLSGSSEATIWAEETFNVNLSGGSLAYYYGSPVHLNELRNSGGSDYISRGEH
jgi:predicted small secreted protein